MSTVAQSATQGIRRFFVPGLPRGPPRQASGAPLDGKIDRTGRGRRGRGHTFPRGTGAMGVEYSPFFRSQKGNPDFLLLRVYGKETKQKAARYRRKSHRARCSERTREGTD